MRTRIAGFAIGVSIVLTGLTAAAPPASAASTVWSAQQIPGQPATFYWAVILGASQYASPSPASPGGSTDAWALRTYLLSQGWRADHIYMVSDLSMTRSAIVAAVGWLASKTNGRSFALFHYSGHEMPFTISGSQHVALWAADNRYLLDTDLASALSHVRAAKMWVDFSTCRAAGFGDAGTVAPNRVVTFSSLQSELSYADAGLNHSLFAYYELVQGFGNKAADSNHDGKVSVEEAFAYARAKATARTGGRQHPAISDNVAGDLFISPH